MTNKNEVPSPFDELDLPKVVTDALNEQRALLDRYHGMLRRFRPDMRDLTHDPHVDETVYSTLLDTISDVQLKLTKEVTSGLEDRRALANAVGERDRALGVIDQIRLWCHNHHGGAPDDDAALVGFLHQVNRELDVVDEPGDAVRDNTALVTRIQRLELMCDVLLDELSKFR